MTVLTFTARLTSIFVFLVNALSDCLSVRNLGLTNVCLNLKFTQKSVYDNFKVKLTHTGDDGLTCFLVGISFESRVFFCKFCKRDTHFFLTCFCFRFNSNSDNGVGEFHRLKDNRVFFIAKGITRCGVLQANRRRDVARVNGVDIFSVVSVHLKNTSHSFFVALAGIKNIGTRIYSTRVNSEVADFTYKRVCCDFKCQSRERFVVRRRSFFFRVRIGDYTFDVGNINRSGHIFNDSVQKKLNTFVSVRCTAKHRNDFIVDCSFSKSKFKLVNCERIGVFKVFFHNSFICFGNSLNHFSSVLFCFFEHIGRNILLAVLFTHFVIVDFSFHSHKVNDTFESILGTDRKLNRNTVCVQTFVHHIFYVVEVGAHNVHFVNVNHSRNVVVVSLAPNGFRLRFNTALSAHNGNRTVEYTERTLNFNSKVNVSRCVDDVNSVLYSFKRTCFRRPEASCSRGSNGYSSFLLLCHPVHSSRTVVCFTDFVVNTGVIQDTFCCSCFTGVNVSHYTDISCIF